jgi:ATP-binding cassette, subfamily B, bacterial
VTTIDGPDRTAIGVGTIAQRGGGWLPILVLTAILGSVTSLALPAALGLAVDAAVTGRDAALWLAAVAGLIVAALACDLLDAYADAACAARTTAWLRNRLVAHLLGLGPAVRRFEAGDLVTRVSGNAASAGRAGPSVVEAVMAAVPPVGALALLAYIDLWIAAAFLAGVVLVAGVLRAFTRRTAAIVSSYQKVQGRIAARLAESLTGARTIAAAGTAAHEQRRILAALPELNAEGIRTWRALGRTAGQAGVVGPLVLVSVLAVGGMALLDGRITAGELLAASRYAVLGAGLGALTGVFGQLARTRAGVQRVAEVLAVEPFPHGTAELPPGPGRLEFRDVTVRAEGSRLLDGVDLTVPGGAAVAVVGRSGAGKSVLAELAARLRDPDAGQVLLDGVPLKDLTHPALRSAAGCAFERPVLVGGTVADAIGLGLDRSTVRAAARATHAHDFVSRLPAGYDTPLAEAPMSGGEIQRLGLARAWHAERLLVLDDATSSLDTVTELQISRTLTGDGFGRTRLIVTHRAATAARADLVVWLEDGRVRATGRHEALWSDPAYREVFS